MRKILISLFLVVSLVALCAVPALADGTWICPACGHENPDRANFCSSCREKKPDNTVQVASTTNAWLCPSCNEVCADEDSFCMICGADRSTAVERALLIPADELLSAQYPAAVIQEHIFTVREKGQEQSLDFTAPVTGTYRIFNRKAESGFRARIRVLDQQGYSLAGDYLRQNTGYSVDLKGGVKYTIVVNQSDGLGEFTLGIGVPKEWTELGDVRVIDDSISFNSQDNRYTFTPKTSGTHRFSVMQAKNGFKLRIRVFDAQGYSLGSDYLTQGNGLSVDLNAGTEYYLHVIQNDDYGDYEVKIGCPKKTTDISGTTLIGDSVVFRTQENVYTFRAPEDGDYTFTVLRVDNNVQVRVRVLDQGGYSLGSEYLKQGGRVKVKLAAGSIYTVKVVQDTKYSTYTLKISH